jgi:ribosomal protein L29
MKKKEFQELKLKKVEELVKLVSAKKSEAMVLIGEKYGKSAAKDVKKVKNLRKDIAQILTLLREKEIMEKEAKPEVK